MARRRSDSFLDNLFEVLVEVPWWGGPVFAGFVYLLFRFFVPGLLGPGAGSDPKSDMLLPAWQMLRTISIGVAPLASLVVLVVWGCAEFKKLVDRRRLDAQTDLDSVRRLSWREFELLMCEAFRRQGYLVEHTGADGPDGGVDLVLWREGRKSLVQCKHWRTESVGVKPIRELLGVVARQDAMHGIFVTSGCYTPEAADFARGAPLTLIGGEEVEAMIRSARSP